jgi:hypothetical protein
MHTSIIKVYDKRYGKWYEGARVVLGWNGFFNLGSTKNFYTNSAGVAIVEHASNGEAEVYINGTHVGYMQTPGSALFEI